MAQGQKEVILITGCSGRIGFKAAERFSSDYQIVGFDVLLAAHLPGVELVAMDMATDKGVQEALDYVMKNYGRRIASVIHLAAYYTFATKWSSQYDRITVEGTRRLLKGLQSFEVEQFIFSSTMLVHCPCNLGEKITEDSPLTTAWGYPRSKVQTEELIRKERGLIPAVILRIAGVYDDT
ncbi:MAG: NAD(P)-dependent oxidoreductase, partial [Chlamydiales bacterium]|nr:NAD(P)-dependent oxidoreductase [Chlamydiales bacterium]